MDRKIFREGNFITINGCIEKVTITMLHEGANEYFKPIQISKQWIDDFGLDQKWFIRPLMFHKISNGYNIISNGVLITTIEYVHQLQNLFFAIKHYELELNNPSNPK